MKTLRKLASTAVLTLGALSLTPSLASAQSANGKFTLTHEVNWQNAVVPAGTYRFSLESRGPSELLTLRSVGGDKGGFMFLVNDVASSQTSGTDQLVLVTRAGKSFVRTLELPKFETVLHFTVPTENADKEMALASDTPVPTHLR
jgi:hypothetical protein